MSTEKKEKISILYFVKALDAKLIDSSFLLCWHPIVITTLYSLFRFNTISGYDGTGSHAECAQRLSAGEAFALSKRALQGDIPMLAGRSWSQAGVPDLTQGSCSAAGGQHERTLRGPRELCLRVHWLKEVGGGNLRFILDHTWKIYPVERLALSTRVGATWKGRFSDVLFFEATSFASTKCNWDYPNRSNSARSYILLDLQNS